MSVIRTILHPTDFSEPAEAAFSIASVLAREHGARVIVLHVYPPPAFHGEVVDRRHGYEADLWHLLDRYQGTGPAVRVEHRLIEGRAAEEIVRLAEEEGCDLIVMGTHGRRGLARLLLGSVAEAVSRRAPCPVLTVRPNAAGAILPGKREEAYAVTA
jgi:nucleotide-binding universal stress UspA family protein